MGFMDWLKTLFGGEETSSSTSSTGGTPSSADRAQVQASSVSGIDDDDVEGAEDVHVHGTDDDARIVRRVPGADLIEEDGEAIWTSRHDDDIPREQWQDVWGPLGGHSEQALVTYFYHENAFNMLQQGDADAAEAKIQEFGYAHVGEFFAARLTILKYWGTPHGPNLGDAVFDSQEVSSAAMKAHRMGLDQQMQANVQANPALLEPIEGITIEQYAQISAQAATGQADFPALLAQFGLDQAAYQRVQAGWTDRMSKDTDATLAQIYGKAFQNMGQGQFGAASQAHASTGWDGTAAGGSEPIPFEKACEIQGATSAWAKTGKDVNALLQATFGMNAMEWASANTWWMSQLTANISRFDEYNSKVEHYEHHYTGGAGKGADSDLEF